MYGEVVLDFGNKSKVVIFDGEYTVVGAIDNGTACYRYEKLKAEANNDPDAYGDFINAFEHQMEALKLPKGTGFQRHKETFYFRNEAFSATIRSAVNAFYQRNRALAKEARRTRYRQCPTPP